MKMETWKFFQIQINIIKQIVIYMMKIEEKKEAYYETLERFFATNKHKLNLNYYDWTYIAYNFDMKK